MGSPLPPIAIQMQVYRLWNYARGEAMKVKTPIWAYIPLAFWFLLFLWSLQLQAEWGGFLGYSVVTIIGATFSIVSILIGKAAARKGRSFAAFFWLSVVLSPIIIGLVIAAMKPLETTEVGNTKKCPACAEMVKTEAVVCRFCGHNFQAA